MEHLSILITVIDTVQDGAVVQRISQLYTVDWGIFGVKISAMTTYDEN